VASRYVPKQKNDKGAAVPVQEFALKKLGKSLPVVGIGAPAGGLEAFEQFSRSVPAKSVMALVLVPHLDPVHASILTENLQRRILLNPARHHRQGRQHEQDPADNRGYRYCQDLASRKANPVPIHRK
jgi:chemotaxis response regulator CheB